MNNLGLTWKKQGRDTEAVTLMNTCVQLRKQILGSEHPFTQGSSRLLNVWGNETHQPN